MADPDKAKQNGGDELTFTSRRARRAKPLTFTLDGEVFKCRPMLSDPVIFEHTKLLRAAAAMEQGAEANEISADAILAFLKLAMGDDEYARFWSFVTDPDRITEWDTLGDIHRVLLRKYSQRPTARSSG